MEQFNKVITAIEHVRRFHPKVVAVYLDGSRWLYTDANGNAPKFFTEIDDDILESALEQVEAIAPVAFRYDPSTRQLSQIDPVEDVTDLVRPVEVRS